MNKNNQKPMIGLTMGDAAGIGPEIVVRALSSAELFKNCRPILIGSAVILEKAAQLVSIELNLNEITRIEEVKENVVNLIDLHNLRNNLPLAEVTAESGRAAMQYIEKATQLAQEGIIAAVVTAPINKEATALAGYADVGHLEYMARLTGSKEYATMLVSSQLRTVHLSTHYSLREALSLVSKERIIARLKLTHNAFVSWGFNKPIIGVAALNPHGGESGMMGREEIDEIIPAVQTAIEIGIDARGPYPSDSVFNRAIAKEFDVVLAMYHDQGHIPIKVFGFEKSVSVALGLPFVRTSVDHGTAYDIAWKGKADARSMKEAIRLAISLVRKNRL